MIDVTIKRPFSPNDYNTRILYSVDGKKNSSIPSSFTFVPVNATRTYSDGRTEAVPSFASYTIITGVTSLPKLIEGSHCLKVYGIYELVQGISGKYPPLMYDVKIVYFTINSGIAQAISNISIENKTYNRNNLPLNFTIDKPSPWMGYSLNGQANFTIAGNTTLTGLADESYNLTIYANDTVGNMATSKPIYFSVETPKQMSYSTEIVGASVSIAVIVTGLIVFYRKKSHK